VLDFKPRPLEPDTRIADRKDACQIVDRLADEGQKITRMPETRWSYLAARLQSGLEVIQASSLDDRQTVERALSVLSPLAEATMAIQGDEATLFGCLFLWERLLSVYSSPSHSRSNVYQTVTARFAYMMTEPYVTIAFFAPTVVKSFEGCVLLEKAIAAYLPPECT
jgi:hypothetical protein